MEKEENKRHGKKIFLILGGICILASIVLYLIVMPNDKSYELEPGYPKEIERDNYSFGARNIIEETQLKEFLGIEPPGDDMDTWLNRKDSAGLQQWKDYWFNIFGSYGRTDLLTFIDSKFVEYEINLNETQTNQIQ